MFTSEYSFKGIHADRVKELVGFKFDKEHSIFLRNMDVYLLAPIVGFLYQRRSPLDKSTNTTKIFTDILLTYQKELEFTYRLIILLDTEHEPDIEKRMNKAFKEYINPDPNDIARYEEYVRGGVDVIYEKLMSGASMPEDYLTNLYQLVEDCESRYGRGHNTQEIVDLCALARG